MLTYTCAHDNGVMRPVRLGCEEARATARGSRSWSRPAAEVYGASRVCHTDADCAGYGTGRCVPANLVFGDLAEDDMCILPGPLLSVPGRRLDLHGLSGAPSGLTRRERWR